MPGISKLFTMVDGEVVFLIPENEIDAKEQEVKQIIGHLLAWGVELEDIIQALPKSLLRQRYEEYLRKSLKDFPG